MTDTISVAGIALSARTAERLKLHLTQLSRWNGSINLAARSTLSEAWHRHVVDSAQLVVLAPPQPRLWADLGSGAGFPGLVVAAILAETSPETTIALVEADRRKSVFLRETARLLDLPTRILSARIEDVAPLGADVVSARALAPMDRLMPLVARHVAPGGVALLLKGRNLDSELASVARAWSFSMERLPSQTTASAEVLRLRDLCHV
jgi:16S rRNA (guanine527-N7)-methyltransferase